MREIIVFDIEANGLLDQVTQIHCLAMMPYLRLGDNSTQKITQEEPLEPLLRAPNQINLSPLKRARVLAGHGIVSYDLPALWKVLGKWETVPLVIDTLILSRFLQPERRGGHSLEAWGERLGFPKGEFSEFDIYTPEMGEYCKQDVRLNYLVLQELEKEYGQPLQGWQAYNK